MMALTRWMMTAVIGLFVPAAESSVAMLHQHVKFLRLMPQEKNLPMDVEPMVWSYPKEAPCEAKGSKVYLVIESSEVQMDPSWISRVKACFEDLSSQKATKPLDIAIDVIGYARLYVGSTVRLDQELSEGWGFLESTIIQFNDSDISNVGWSIDLLSNVETIDHSIIIEADETVEFGEMMDLRGGLMIAKDGLDDAFTVVEGVHQRMNEYIRHFQYKDEKESEQAISPKGSLLLAGGYTPDVTFEEFYHLAGGSSGRIVVIPSASPKFNVPDYRERNFAHWFERGFASVTILHTDDRSVANTDAFVEPLKHATGVWISGGEQERLAERYVGTKVQELIRKVYETGGVVGGTSAGATIMSDAAIMSGRRDLWIARGFDLLPKVTIDQHFTAERREHRLLAVLNAVDDHYGIGIDEETVLLIRDNMFKVLGEGAVYFVSRRDANRQRKLAICRDQTEFKPLPFPLF